MLDEVKKKKVFIFPMAHIRRFIFWWHFALTVQIQLWKVMLILCVYCIYLLVWKWICFILHVFPAQVWEMVEQLLLNR